MRWRKRSRGGPADCRRDQGLKGSRAAQLRSTASVLDSTDLWLEIGVNPIDWTTGVIRTKPPAE